jgi:hypothetical protein
MHIYEKQRFIIDEWNLINPAPIVHNEGNKNSIKTVIIIFTCLIIKKKFLRNARVPRNTVWIPLFRCLHRQCACSMCACVHCTLCSEVQPLCTSNNFQTLEVRLGLEVRVSRCSGLRPFVVTHFNTIFFGISCLFLTDHKRWVGQSSFISRR